jgi:filamentous hemagglutinin family protein
VPTGNTASFRGVDAATANLLMRVTGTNPSSIDGKLEVLQPNGRVSPANVFLLNPNGILFGPHGSLHVGGAFLATTANSIRFADGGQFSAVAPQAGALLTVSVPVGLQFGSHPGRIVNQSIAPLQDNLGNLVLDSFQEPITGLSVPEPHMLALVGGAIDLPGGSIRVNGGNIALGSVLGAGEVSLTPTDSGWQLGYGGIRRFGDIRLTAGAADGALIDASGAPGGAIQIRGRHIAVTGGSQINSFNLGAQPGGSITVNAAASLAIRGVDGFNSSLFTQTSELGNAGDISVNAPRVHLQDLGAIASQTAGSGAAGNIRVSTQRLTIRSGAFISSSTDGAGHGGNVRVNASDAVSIIGPRLYNSDTVLSAQTFSDNPNARAGTLTVKTDRLVVRSGGQVNTTTFGAGDAGNLIVQARSIDLDGVALNSSGDPILNQRGLPFPSGLFAGTEAGSSGDGGALQVYTQQLRLSNGAILYTTTFGSGDAGDLTVRSADSVEISGTGGGRFPSGLVAISGGLPGSGFGSVPSATGAGGSLTLTTGSLSVRDGAVVAVSSINPEASGAGRLRVNAPLISLDGGQLNARTESGKDASIDLRRVNLLLLRDRGEITTSAGLSQGGGDGGDIAIHTDFILTNSAENSDITANAGEGNGGNIDINALGVLGVTQRDRLTAASDINASSKAGVDGQITVNAIDVDPTRGLIELPSNLIDASQLVAQRCTPGRNASATQSEFVVTGRGGLPPNPTEPQASEAALTDWATLEPEMGRSLSQTIGNHHRITQTDPASASPIVEAQGWVVGEHGRVQLVAQSDRPTQHLTDTAPITCDRRNRE